MKLLGSVFCSATGLMLVSFAGPAFSCTCRGATLQEYYDRAESIVVAKKAGCVVSPVDSRGRCPDDEWYFDIVEVLKGSSAPSRTFHGAREFHGAKVVTVAGCGLTFQRFESFLLFLGEAGQLAGCNGSGPLDAGSDSYQYRSRVDTIREYRDGDFNDLSSPWVFANVNSTCGINHSSNGAGLSFTYIYADPEVKLELYTESVRGPEPKSGLPVLSVHLPSPHKIVEGSVFIHVGGSKWLLERRIYRPINWPSNISKNLLSRIPDRVSEVIMGPLVLDILGLMSDQTNFEITATRAQEAILVEGRTTRIADASEQFMSCLKSSPNAGENKQGAL